MTAQPFACRQACGKRDHPRTILAPDQARKAEAEGWEQRQISGQAQYGERHQPCEGRRVDQERVADPVESRHEIAKAEPPAGHRRRGQAVQAPAARAVDQPNHHRKSQEQNGPCIERRHRERRQRPRDGRNGGAFPAP